MIAQQLALLDRVLVAITHRGRIFFTHGKIVGRTIEAEPVYDVLIDGTREIVNRVPRNLMVAEGENINGR